jgi:hypothetical protein
LKEPVAQPVEQLTFNVPERERLRALLFALKIANLFVARHEYRLRQVTLSARVGFMLDPTNGCQLGCATCCNTFNEAFAAQTFNPFPRGIMKANLYTEIIEGVGPYAFVGHFYNNSEPFLNKLTPQFLRQAHHSRAQEGINYRSVPPGPMGADLGDYRDLIETASVERV